MNRTGLWILAFLIAAAGCHKQVRGVALAPAPAPPVSVAAALPPMLIEGDSAFDSGDFLRAAVSYEFYFQTKPQSNEMDRILFRFGVSQSLSGVSGLEAASTDTFKQLLNDYPDSSFVAPARMGLALQADIVRLQADKSLRDERIRQLTALIPPPPPVLPAALAEAEAAYDTGDFARAAIAYESYLQSKPQASGMDGILFRFAVSQSLCGVSVREAASNDIFKQLIKEFSTSPYATSAGRILDYRDRSARSQQSDLKSKDDKIRQLNDELDKLKKIDSERRRTP